MRPGNTQMVLAEGRLQDKPVSIAHLSQGLKKGLKVCIALAEQHAGTTALAVYNVHTAQKWSQSTDIGSNVLASCSGISCIVVDVQGGVIALLDQGSIFDCRELSLQPQPDAVRRCQGEGFT